MIRYAVRCARDHEFESWFQSAEAFDRLATAGHVTCPACGDTRVTKSLMAPRVRPARAAAEAPGAAKSTAAGAPPAATQPGGTRPMAAVPDGPLSAHRSPAEAALAALRAHVEKNSEYVGTEFSARARAMHAGEAEARPIWGEARLADAKALIEDGVPVAPLPFLPTRKAN